MPFVLPSKKCIVTHIIAKVLNTNDIHCIMLLKMVLKNKTDSK